MKQARAGGVSVRWAGAESSDHPGAAAALRPAPALCLVVPLAQRDLHPEVLAGFSVP